MWALIAIYGSNMQRCQALMVLPFFAINSSVSVLFQLILISWATWTHNCSTVLIHTLHKVIQQTDEHIESAKKNLYLGIRYTPFQSLKIVSCFVRGFRDLISKQTDQWKSNGWNRKLTPCKLVCLEQLLLCIWGFSLQIPEEDRDRTATYGC